MDPTTKEKAMHNAKNWANTYLVMSSLAILAGAAIGAFDHDITVSTATLIIAGFLLGNRAQTYRFEARIIEFSP